MEVLTGFSPDPKGSVLSLIWLQACLEHRKKQVMSTHLKTADKMLLYFTFLIGITLCFVL